MSLDNNEFVVNPCDVNMPPILKPDGYELIGIDRAHGKDHTVTITYCFRMKEWKIVELEEQGRKTIGDKDQQHVLGMPKVEKW